MCIRDSTNAGRPRAALPAALQLLYAGGAAGLYRSESGFDSSADVAGPGERIASTTNRNFVGRQGERVKTHLVSPAMAAAAAVTGRLADVRTLAPAEGG